MQELCDQHMWTLNVRCVTCSWPEVREGDGRRILRNVGTPIVRVTRALPPLFTKCTDKLERIAHIECGTVSTALHKSLSYRFVVHGVPLYR